MNKSIITAQILSSPKLIKYNTKYVVLIIISIPNNKKNISFLTIKTHISGSFLYQLYNFYVKKDLCILEGNISIYNDIFINHDLYDKYKIKKYLYFNIYRVQPFIKN